MPAVERTRHTQDSQDQILALTIGQTTRNPFELLTLRSAVDYQESVARESVVCRLLQRVVFTTGPCSSQ